MAFANYEVDPKILANYLPRNTELDLWNGSCYVSLVGFMFLNTRLMGIPIPFHQNFEEINLRFYVKYREGGTWKRGGLFIKEIVPKVALTFVANTIFREHFQTMKMSHSWKELEDHRMVQYNWKSKGSENSFSIKAALETETFEKGTEAEFISEHYWGYTKSPDNATYEYEVVHPRWDIYKVLDYRMEVDFSDIYGREFSELSSMEPTSIILAEGSSISVENKRRI